MTTTSEHRLKPSKPSPGGSVRDALVENNVLQSWVLVCPPPPPGRAGGAQVGGCAVALKDWGVCREHRVALESNAVMSHVGNMCAESRMWIVWMLPIIMCICRYVCIII